MAKIYTKTYGSNPYEWGSDIVFSRIDAETMITYAPARSKFPE